MNMNVKIAVWMFALAITSAWPAMAQHFIQYAAPPGANEHVRKWDGFYLDIAARDPIVNVDGYPGSRCLALTTSQSVWRLNPEGNGIYTIQYAAPAGANNDVQKYDGYFLDIAATDSIGRVDGYPGGRCLALTSSKSFWRITNQGGNYLIQYSAPNGANQHVQKWNGFYLDIAAKDPVGNVDGYQGGRCVVLSNSKSFWRLSQ